MKVKKNKLFHRLFYVEEDLSAVAWKSSHKKPNKARSESSLERYKKGVIEWYTGTLVSQVTPLENGDLIGS